jgi:nucleotide-binding universal stress UspA family protein
VYRKLIVPLDGSSFAEYALATAARLAKASGAEIQLLTVHFPSLFAFDRGAHYDELLRSEERAYLARIGTMFRAETDVTVHGAIRDGVPAEAICEYADWFGDALIVMTTHGRTGVNRAWVGSVADAVMKHSNHAVLMLRPPKAAAPWTGAATADYHRVLVPLDGSAFAEIALAHGVRLAELFGAKLELLRVAEIPQPFVVPFTAPPYAGVPMVPTETIDSIVQHATGYVNDVASRVRAEHPQLIVVTDLVASETPALSIVDIAEQHGVDLVAMATHGRGVSRLVVPSVADKVLRGGPAAVLLVKVASD